MIDEASLDKALGFLAATDERSAKLKSLVAETEYLAKLSEQKFFLTAEGSVDQRKATAKMNQECQDAWGKHFKAIVDYERVRAKRERAVLTVDLYRTMSANRRVGNI